MAYDLTKTEFLEDIETGLVRAYRRKSRRLLVDEEGEPIGFIDDDTFRKLPFAERRAMNVRTVWSLVPLD